MIEVNRIRGVLIAIAVSIALGGCASDETKAERLYREATTRIDRSEFRDAVARLERILADYPETETAEKVRREIDLYRGLDRAVRSFPMRTARDRMVRIARAIESHRNRRRSYPESLDVLVPGKLSDLPDDPWGRPFLYRVTGAGRGYRLECHGEDGVPGGDGDDADLVVVNGRFVTGPSE